MRSAHFVPATLELGGFNVLDTGRDDPDVPKRVFKPSGTVTIELIGDGNEQLGAGVHRGVYGSVGVIDVDMQMAG